MANDAYTQQALANDAQFRRRVKSALASVAQQIIAEAPATTNHAHRLNYAYSVVRNVESEAATVVQTLVMRPNVLNFTTSYDFAAQAVVTTAGDPDLQSQIFTDWDTLAAAAGFHS